MIAAGYILTGQRRLADQAHPPLIVAHSLNTDFFGVDELAAPYAGLHNFNVWPATAAVLAQLAADRLPGHNSLDEFSCWRDPRARRIIICTEDERARAAESVSALAR